MSTDYITELYYGVILQIILQDYITESYYGFILRDNLTESSTLFFTSPGHLLLPFTSGVRTVGSLKLWMRFNAETPARVGVWRQGLAKRIILETPQHPHLAQYKIPAYCIIRCDG